MSACGGDDDDDSAPKPMGGQTCSGGESFSCRSRTGCSGHQFCTDEGVLGACICDQPSTTPGGSGGMGGDAGERDGGSAESGSGGRSGNGGQSGSAGQAGSAGKPAEQDAGQPVDAGKAPVGTEQCDNGKDDDGDGDTDCADDDCGTRSCLPAAPDGWMGPTALRIGTALPDACAGDYGSEVARGGTAVSAADATCSACSCTPSSPGCATFLDFVTSADPNCGGAMTCAQPVTTSCEVITSSCLQGLTTGYVAAKLPAGTATCAPSAQTPSTSDPAWQLEMLACGASDDLVRGGCENDQLCAPKQPSDAVLCVVHSGDMACPAGPYSERRTFYTGFNDTRDCSDCTCAHDCNYGWKVYDAADTTCSLAPVVTLGGPMCVGVAPSGNMIRVGLALTGSGACEAGGGEPTGSAAASGPLTACCVP